MPHFKQATVETPLGVATRISHKPGKVSGAILICAVILPARARAGQVLRHFGRFVRGKRSLPYLHHAVNCCGPLRGRHAAVGRRTQFMARRALALPDGFERFVRLDAARIDGSGHARALHNHLVRSGQTRPAYLDINGFARLARQSEKTY